MLGDDRGEACKNQNVSIELGWAASGRQGICSLDVDRSDRLYNRIPG